MSGGIDLHSSGSTSALRGGANVPDSDEYTTQTFPAWAMGVDNAPTAGIVYCAAVYLVPRTYTSFALGVGGTAAATAANSFVGFYDTSYNLLYTSADVSATLNGTAQNTPAICTISWAETQQGWRYAAFVIGSAGTVPTLRQSGAQFTTIYGTTASVATPYVAFRDTGTGRTSLPASVTPNTSSGAKHFWARVF